MQNIIIGTGCYSNINSGNLVSVTGDGGNAWGYFGAAYKKLAPSWDLYTTWRDNPHNLNPEELINYYIEQYFKHRLENLDIQQLLLELETNFGSNIILLCHEQPGDFCHRRVIADFIELKTGIMIPELAYQNGDLTEVEQPVYKDKIRSLICK